VAGRRGVAVAASLAAAVRTARPQADVVVVYLHWGTDCTTCPNALQKPPARALADTGADVVVGTHAPGVQGAGWLGRTYVSYGLGNSVWWRRSSVTDATSGRLNLDVEGRRVTAARWLPMLVGADGIPRKPDAATSERMQRDWVDARACAGLSATPSGELIREPKYTGVSISM
jgi:poly-gamma-glutamate synthesis protein (capsule biosynthesis protein)